MIKKKKQKKRGGKSRIEFFLFALTPALIPLVALDHFIAAGAII